MQSSVTVIIPIYKSNLTENEVRSFKRCLNVLEKHPISLICPKKLDISFCEAIALRFQKQIKIERFKDKYFSNFQGYNRLMLFLEFYNRFKNFEYILIYQLDAWVFRDELDYWCNKGYDYIGASWFDNYKNFGEKFMEFAGNGGFSLRKVRSTLFVLKTYKYYRTPVNLFVWEFNNSSLIRFLFRLPIIFLKVLGIRNTFKHYTRNYKSNEDAFWVNIVPEYFPDFKIAPYREAIPFAFECQPQKLFEMNNCKLPFGCHAWEKYDYEIFWKNYIQ